MYTAEEINRIGNALEHESERGCVLVATAWIEGALERLLRAYFKRVSRIVDGVVDDLLNSRNPNAALGPASAKNRLCEALGLINAQTANKLANLLKYRNAAAHFRETLSLGMPRDGEAKRLLDALCADSEKDEIFTEKEFPQLSTDRRRFMNVAVDLALTIGSAIDRLADQKLSQSSESASD